MTTELQEIKKVVEYIKEKGLEEYLPDILEVEPEIFEMLEEEIDLEKLKESL